MAKRQLSYTPLAGARLADSEGEDDRHYVEPPTNADELIEFVREQLRGD